MADVYAWVAEYTDGTQVDEADPNGDHAWADVDVTRLRYIHLLSAWGVTVFSAAIPPGVIAEVFRRRTINVSAGSHDEVSRSSVTCVGWPGAYFWLTDDGVMALTAVKD